MASDRVVSADAEEGPFTNPWPALSAGLTAAALAMLWYWILGPRVTPIRLVLLSVGLLAGGVAIAIRPSSVWVVALAGVVALMAWAGMSPQWDTACMLVSLLALVAFASAFLLLLPQLVRRTVVTLLVVLHFSGILCAVTSVPPQPWLTTYIWTYVYRPYLEFMYLNNAYHFYSPDPGPANLLWFRIHYADNSARWVKLPNRDDFPLAVNYQRRLSLAESTNQLLPNPANFELRLRYRLEAGNQRDIKMHPELPPAFQLREPNSYSQRMVQTYARHVAHAYPHLESPETPVVGVKVYRVVHSIPGARDFANGLEPLDETLYLPYYQGEFDSEGNLKEPTDPFLYWLIPILKEEKPSAFRAGVGAPRKPDPRNYVVKDYVKIHAGDRE
jgi:hypothetical protein